MLSLNEKLSEVQFLGLRATFHALPLFYLRTYILRTYAVRDTGNQPLVQYVHLSFQSIQSVCVSVRPIRSSVRLSVRPITLDT